MTPRRMFTRDSPGLAFTQYLMRAMSRGRGFVAAKLLDPTSFGTWNALQLMMDYGALAPLGEKATVKDDLGELIEAITAAARSGDHVLVMSNGGFGGIHEKLLNKVSQG